jgi:hypothetical protein
MLLRIAAGKLKAKPQFTVYQQYPREIYERRRNLIPKIKKLKRQKHTVKLVYNKLIVDDRKHLDKVFLKTTIIPPDFKKKKNNSVFCKVSIFFGQL